MQIKYKDSNNEVHQIEEGYEHLLPAGCIQITDAEADAINASKVVPPTYQQLRASAYPSIADQLDTIYHGGIDAWKATITAVKEEIPK
tara:strand:- start:86 stop:349 length:264 start_codon:yes stop_codon:yes gene_type:complete